MSNEDLSSIFTPAVEPEPVAPSEPVVEPVVEEPAPAEPVVKSKKNTAPSSTLTGLVSISILKTHQHSHNSASVALIQKRLIELGFTDAGLDNLGHMAKNTVKALAMFDGSDPKTYLPAEATVRKLFEGTAVEVVA